MTTYRVTKTITAEQGWSVAFRQWRATDSHCQYLHGYALSCDMVFEADELDHRHWVIDFGAFATLRDTLNGMFDHRTIVAIDDPLLPVLEQAEAAGALRLTLLPAVGCEAFAQTIGKVVQFWLRKAQHRWSATEAPRLVSVTVREHGSNAATVVFR